MIAITEGELDAITLNQIGVPAVAIAGSNNWKPHYARIFTGFSKVLVVGDNDKAGRDFAAKVCKQVESGLVVTIEGDEREDVNSLFVKKGREAVLDALGIQE